MTKIEALASEMNVTPSDVSGFVACIGLWMAKGQTMEQAIDSHMCAMTALVNNSVQISDVGKPLAVEWFFGVVI